MKKLVIILSTLLFLLPTLQAQQPQFTEFRTVEERENGEWQYKITDEAEVEDYILQLVTSKEESDYHCQWICVQVLDKNTRQLVQEMELHGWGRGDSFEFGDYNFDGYEDFSLDEGYGSLDNRSCWYFLFDPETKTFFLSGFYGANLEFHSDTKTITSRSRCCAGAQIFFHTYKLDDNRMVLLEELCLKYIDEEDEEGNLIFEEIDCRTPYLDIELQSVELKKNFYLRMAIYDEDMAGGFVLYDGQEERIPIHFDRSETIEEDESYPDGSRAKLFYYNEMYKGEINGVYTFVMRASVVDNVHYIRKKDEKVFTLEIERQRMYIQK